mmetsp:Transcript_61530/g.172146  ORF Transcript_61530/g.172146 Transcript_61530/m.172146 type:complete len:249 (+) Transcript_61530:1135-1881(+)
MGRPAPGLAAGGSPRRTWTPLLSPSPRPAKRRTPPPSQPRSKRRRRRWRASSASWWSSRPRTPTSSPRNPRRRPLSRPSQLRPSPPRSTCLRRARSRTSASAGSWRALPGCLSLPLRRRCHRRRSRSHGRPRRASPPKSLVPCPSRQLRRPSRRRLPRRRSGRQRGLRRPLRFRAPGWRTPGRWRIGRWRAPRRCRLLGPPPLPRGSLVVPSARGATGAFDAERCDAALGGPAAGRIDRMGRVGARVM